MAFQATIIPPIRGDHSPCWDILIAPEYWQLSQTNGLTLHDVSSYVGSRFSWGRNKEYPEVSVTEAGALRIQFEDNLDNFEALRRALEWLENPPHDFIC
jgi:hypothetical protein